MTRHSAARLIDKLLGLAVAAIVCIGLLLAASCTCVPGKSYCPPSFPQP